MQDASAHFIARMNVREIIGEITEWVRVLLYYLAEWTERVSPTVCQATREYFRKRDDPTYKFLGISRPAKVDLDEIGELFDDDWF